LHPSFTPSDGDVLPGSGSAAIGFAGRFGARSACRLSALAIVAAAARLRTSLRYRSATSSAKCSMGTAFHRGHVEPLAFDGQREFEHRVAVGGLEDEQEVVPAE
jgi:hypothetical protein